MTQPTWRSALAAAVAEVGELDARRLVERASGYDSGTLIVHLDEVPTPQAQRHLDQMVDRRRGGEPLQYVVGAWGFRHLDLYLDRRVLIPRPETEQVVEVVMAELARLASIVSEPTVVDLGTGSGAIALAVASEVPAASVWGTDRSAEALAVARANLAGIGRPATRVQLAEGDWFEALPGDLAGTIDLVVSNPPYVAADDELPAVVAEWEPRSALVSGPTGREALEHLVDEAPSWLASHGVLVLELAPKQVATLVERAVSRGYAEVVVHPDLADRPRALVARRS